MGSLEVISYSSCGPTPAALTQPLWELWDYVTPHENEDKPLVPTQTENFVEMPEISDRKLISRCLEEKGPVNPADAVPESVDRIRR